MEIFKKIMLGIAKVILFNCMFLFMFSFSIKGLMNDGISVILSNKLAQIPEFEIVVKEEKVNELIKSPETQEFIKEFVEPMIDSDVDISKIDIGGDVLTFIETNKEKLEAIVGQPIDISEVEKVVKSEEFQEVNKQYIEIVSRSRETVPVSVKNTIHAYTYFMSSEFRALMGIIGGVMLFVIALIKKPHYSFIKTFGKSLAGNGFMIGVISIFWLFAANGLFKIMEFENVTFDYKNALIMSGVSLVTGIIIVVVYNKIIKRKEIATSE